MCATSPMRLNAGARVQTLTLADRQDNPQAQAVPALRPDLGPETGPETGPQRRQRLRRWLTSALVLAVLWGMLTNWRADAVVFGLPAVVVGATLGAFLPSAPGWRLSLRGALAFALWFGVQSLRGAIDVAGRAFSPDMGLRPCFRPYPLTLPQGAPRVMFINTITLLPGTLSAEIHGDTLIVHMLDARTPLEPELADLETRIRALFALPPSPEHS